MNRPTRPIKITRVSGGRVKKTDDLVVREVPVTVQVNGKEYAVLMASPVDLDALAVGFLVGEGAVTDATNIDEVHVDERTFTVRVSLSGEFDALRRRGLVTSGCAAVALFKGALDLTGLAPVRARTRFPASHISKMVMALNSRSETFRKTGGIHAAAIADKNDILLFAEDIGRHNAVDKLVGRALLDSRPLYGTMLVLTGRVSSEIVVKAARSRVPVVVSRAAPTDMAVRLAKSLGVTLAGFVRGKRINVYSKEWRIKNDE